MQAAGGKGFVKRQLEICGTRRQIRRHLRWSRINI